MTNQAFVTHRGQQDIYAEEIKDPTERTNERMRRIRALNAASSDGACHCIPGIRHKVGAHYLCVFGGFEDEYRDAERADHEDQERER